jgi:phosphatidylserine/phosphatidylglycerophosphate/cardiolipin synthase-like enzyme
VPAALLLVVLALAAIVFARAGGDIVPRPASPRASPQAQRTAAVGGNAVPANTVTGAWYQVGFTAPRPDDDRLQPGGLDQQLVSVIDRAHRSIDVAIYDLDLETVTQALVRAARRGVRVRVVMEADTVNDLGHRFVQQALTALRAEGIPIVADQRRGLMHHKFTVVDGEWVQTGSWNYTHSDTFRANNNGIVIQSRALAANFSAEFEKLLGRSRSGAAKSPGVPHPVLDVTGARVETYFSPQDRAAVHVIRWIGSARQRIRFMAFSFTHDGIGEAVLDRWRAGVDVAGVFETSGSQTEFSELRQLREAGIDVLQDGNPWAMHHKVVVIDRRISVFGSFNFSAAGDRSNDENLLIVDDPSLADAFEREYERVRVTALQAGTR